MLVKNNNSVTLNTLLP